MCKLAGLPFEYAPRQGEPVLTLDITPGQKITGTMSPGDDLQINFWHDIDRWEVPVNFSLGGATRVVESHLSDPRGLYLLIATAEHLDEGRVSFKLNAFMAT